MAQLLTIVQAGTGILLIIAILMQQRGTGLSGSFGGEGNVYRAKRGVEKILFYVTIAIALLFFGVSLVQLFLVQ